MTACFMEEYRGGRVDAGDLVDWVERWVQLDRRNPAGPGLEDWLGMTWAEFNAWYFRRELPRR